MPDPIVSRPSSDAYRAGWERVFGTPNRCRYFCVSCDEEIKSPGMGHSLECAIRTVAFGSERVRYEPAPYIIDGKGEYYANLQGGYEVLRKIPERFGDYIRALDAK